MVLATKCFFNPRDGFWYVDTPNNMPKTTFPAMARAISTKEVFTLSPAGEWRFDGTWSGTVSSDIKNQRDSVIQNQMEAEGVTPTQLAIAVDNERQAREEQVTEAVTAEANARQGQVDIINAALQALTADEQTLTRAMWNTDGQPRGVISGAGGVGRLNIVEDLVRGTRTGAFDNSDPNNPSEYVRNNDGLLARVEELERTIVSSYGGSNCTVTDYSGNILPIGLSGGFSFVLSHHCEDYYSLLINGSFGGGSGGTTPFTWSVPGNLSINMSSYSNFDTLLSFIDENTTGSSVIGGSGTLTASDSYSSGGSSPRTTGMSFTIIRRETGQYWLDFNLSTALTNPQFTNQNNGVSFSGYFTGTLLFQAKT